MITFKQYIDKDALVAEVKARISDIEVSQKAGLIKKRDADKKIILFKSVLSLIDTLEVLDPYEQCVQYDSIKAGIQAHAETYSFSIESELFNQLTKEQQALWRKEIEQACISGGDAGVELARDIRYKENIEVKEVNLEKEIELVKGDYEQLDIAWNNDFDFIAKHFYELGLKKGE